MALVVADLQTSLQAFITSPPPDVSSAASGWANAYFTYALKAQAADALPLALAAVTSAPLAGLFATSMSKFSFLDDLPANLTTFWLSPPVLFTGANNGSTTAVAGAPVLATAIAAIKEANQKANLGIKSLDLLATALDVFTKTVVVALVNPSGVTIPTTLL